MQQLVADIVGRPNRYNDLVALLCRFCKCVFTSSGQFEVARSHGDSTPSPFGLPVP